MKYALFDFVNEDGATEIGESVWIEGVDVENCNDQDFRMETEVVVQWPISNSRPARKVVAKVLHFSDDQKHLREVLRRYLESGDVTEAIKSPARGRGHRIPKKKKELELCDSDSDSEIVPQKMSKKAKDSSKAASMKNKSEALLHALKEKMSDDDDITQPVVISPSPTEWRSYKQEVKDLKVRVGHLEALLQDMREELYEGTPRQDRPLPVQRLSPNTLKLSSSKAGRSSVPLMEPENQLTLLSGADETKVYTLPEHAVARSNYADARKMTNDLMEAVFTTKDMCNHSVTGSVSNKRTPAKPALPRNKIISIIDHVRRQFPAKEDKDVRTYMREKLSNVTKTISKRQVVEEEPSKA